MLFNKNCFNHLISTFIGACIASYSIALPTELKQTLQAFDQQDFEKAKTRIDQSSQEPKYQQIPSIWYYRGVIYDQLMRKNITADLAPTYLEEALAAYRKTLMVSKKNTQYHSFANINMQALWAYYVNRAVQYYKVEAFEEALEQLTISKKIYTDTPQTLLYMAIVAHQAEKYELALEHYQKYIKSDATTPAVYRALANLTAHYLKKSDEAYKILYNAMQQYPWDINLLEEYYQLLVQSNQLANKQTELQDQLKEVTSNPTVYYQLAYLYLHENKYEEAAWHYEKALELAPHQLAIILQLAKSYYNQGANTLREIADIPEEMFQQEGKELIEKVDKYLEKSLQYYEKANKLSSNNLEILGPMYTLYMRLNKSEKANQIARKIKQIKGGIQLLESI